MYGRNYIGYLPHICIEILPDVFFVQVMMYESVD